jgi:hypothetical protein
MLSLCFNTRVCYLTRTAETNLIWDSLGLFDAAIDHAVAGIAHASSTTPEIRALRSLPCHLGGLGLTRHQGSTTERNCLAARTSVRRYIDEFRPELMSGTQLWPALTQAGEGDQSLYALELSTLTDATVTELDSTLPTDLIATVAQHKRVWYALYADLQRQGNRRHHMAWLLSSACTGTGRFLSWHGGSDGRFRFTDGEYRECLRLRLLLDPFPLPGDLECPSCPGVRIRSSPSHALDCDSQKTRRRNRHDQVRDHLAELLKTVHPTAIITCEEFIGDEAGDFIFELFLQLFEYYLIL